MRRHPLAEVGLVLVASSGAILLAEGVVRLVAPQTLPSQALVRLFVLKNMYLPDERAGFRPAPGFHGRIEWAGHVTEFHFNSMGLRNDELGPKARPRIAAFGDSFTWGWGCPQGQEWIHVAGREISVLGGPSVETVNCGVNAYGTAAECGFLEEIGGRVAPDLVLLGFFPNDYTDNLLADLRGEPGVYTIRDGYLFDKFSHEYFHENFLARESHLYRLLASAQETFRVRYLHGIPSARPVKQFTDVDFRRGLDLSERYIRRMKQISAAHGARFAVIWLPPDYYAFTGSRPEDISLQWELQRRIAAAGIPSLDLLPVITAQDRIRGLYIPDDGHFTERGNAVAGRAVGQWILDSGLLSDAPLATHAKGLAR